MKVLQGKGQNLIFISRLSGKKKKRSSIWIQRESQVVMKFVKSKMATTIRQALDDAKNKG